MTDKPAMLGKSPSGKDNRPICLKHVKGICAKGDNCDERHTQTCYTWASGQTCPFGENCLFPHRTKHWVQEGLKGKASPATTSPGPKAKATAKPKAPKKKAKAKGKTQKAKGNTGTERGAAAGAAAVQVGLEDKPRTLREDFPWGTSPQPPTLCQGACQPHTPPGDHGQCREQLCI